MLPESKMQLSTRSQREHSPASRLPRIICYYQTHYQNGQFVSLLPLLSNDAGATHVILAAIHLNELPGDVTLNDDPYTAAKYAPLWEEKWILQNAGIKVLGMLGGAHVGSYSALDGSPGSFEAYYEPLRQMVVWTGLDGLDLDVEEDMSLAGIIRLIDRLKSDFGPDFLVTLTPVATALQNEKHLSGFNYEDLEKAVGSKIAWYNTQFYCGWGSMETTQDYDKISARGWPAEKVVVGVVTNPENCEGWVPDDVLRLTLAVLVREHPHFGGVYGWEYFNSITVAEPYEGPWSWARMMVGILRSSPIAEQAVEPCGGRSQGGPRNNRVRDGDISTVVADKV